MPEPETSATPSDKPQPPQTSVFVLRGDNPEDAGKQPDWDLLTRLDAEEPAPLKLARRATGLAAELEQQARAIEQRGAVVPRDLTANLVEARAKAREAESIIRATQQVDPLKYAYGEGWAIPPYIDPFLTTKAALSSDALTTCIEAMGRGVAGHGYELVPRIGAEAYKLLTEDARKDIEEEKLAIEAWFEGCNPDIPFGEVYNRLEAMRETTGFTFCELLPDEAGELCGLEPMPSYCTRITPGADEVLSPVPRRAPDGSWGHRLVWRRFRRVIQYINGQYKWFKFLGDPRFIDGATGTVIGNEWLARRTVEDASSAARAARAAEIALELVRAEAAGTVEQRGADLPDRLAAAEERSRLARADASKLDDKRAAAQQVLDRCAELREAGREAHEVMLWIHFGVSGYMSPYGAPRWFGASYSAIGRQKAQILGMSFFDNNGIPRLLVTVAGALLTTQQVKQVEDHFRGFKGLDKQNDALVIQAAPGGGGAASAFDEARGQIKINVVKLNDAVLSEATFRESAKDWLNDVRRAFNLPPILTGDSDDYARAVADTARLIAEENVFQPERVLFDYMINHQLFPRLGFHHWLFHTGGAHISDEASVVALLQLLHESAGGSTEELREFITSKLGKKLPPIGQPWAARPSKLNGALAGLGVDPSTGLKIGDVASGTPGTATVPEEDPDTDPAEIVDGTGDGGGKAQVEAEHTEEASDSPDGGKAPTRSAPPRRLVRVEVDPEVLRTAEGLLRLDAAIQEALRLKDEEERAAAA